MKTLILSAVLAVGTLFGASGIAQACEGCAAHHGDAKAAGAKGECPHMAAMKADGAGCGCQKADAKCDCAKGECDCAKGECPHMAGAKTDGAKGECPHMAAAKADGAKKADASATYTCPMHPKVVQKGPGSCPDCGMKLVPQSQIKKK